MNRPGILFKQSKMESSLQPTVLKGTILRMNGDVRIAAGSLVIVAGLFLVSCAGDSDVPSAYGTGVPSAPNPDVPTGPESGEADFSQHQ
jgi:hypothetical protein